jgi:RNA polymerase sigma factor (TIGR02999 family)
MEEITRVLKSYKRDGGHNSDELLSLVYSDLRRLAAYKLANERPGQTLQSTALVHEAWMRLSKNKSSFEWNSCRQFYAAAAEAMRRILIDKARHKKSIKGGGEQMRVEFDETQICSPLDDDEFLALHEALDEFEEEFPREAELVKLRFFVGLTHKEASDVLGLSRTAADRMWLFARAWLYQKVNMDDVQ